LIKAIFRSDRAVFIALFAALAASFNNSMTPSINSTATMRAKAEIPIAVPTNRHLVISELVIRETVMKENPSARE